MTGLRRHCQAPKSIIGADLALSGHSFRPDQPALLKSSVASTQRAPAGSRYELQAPGCLGKSVSSSTWPERVLPKMDQAVGFGAAVRGLMASAGPDLSPSLRDGRFGDAGGAFAFAEYPALRIEALHRACPAAAHPDWHKILHSPQVPVRVQSPRGRS